MKVLYFAYVWPEPNASAAGLRTYNLLDALRELGHDVVCASACQANPALNELKGRGFRAYELLLNDSGSDQVLSKSAPEAVIFDRFVTEEQWGWRVHQYFPNALRLLDTQDLHFLRLTRAAEFIFPEKGNSENSDDVMLREMASIHRSDGVWVLSPVERELLMNQGVSPHKIKVSPFGYPQSILEKPARPLSERVGIGWIGNSRHDPNRDGLIWFLCEIWPQVLLGNPNARLKIAGSYLAKEIVERAERSKGAEIVGWVDDSIEFLSRCRVSIAPLRFGAGIKGKVCDSLVAGTPVVTTSIGAEGIFEPTEGCVCDERDSFSKKILEFLKDDVTNWTKESARLKRIANQKYHFDDMKKSIGSLMEWASGSLQEIRKHNVTGRILMREELRSTEFMSRWIELKNQSKNQIAK